MFRRLSPAIFGSEPIQLYYRVYSRIDFLSAIPFCLVMTDDRAHVLPSVFLPIVLQSLYILLFVDLCRCEE